MALFIDQLSAAVRFVVEVTSYMANEVVSVDDDVMDFTQQKKPRRFKLDDDIFTLVRDLPTFLLIEFTEHVDKFQQGSAVEKKKAMETLFRLVLVPESADVFMARMSDPLNPIGVKSVQDILPWIMEQYGLRPTEPSGTSSDGSDNLKTGTNSTDVVASTESTLESSASTDS